MAMKVCPVIYKEQNENLQGNGSGISYSPVEVACESGRRVVSVLGKAVNEAVLRVRLIVNNLTTDRVKLAQKRNPTKQEILILMSDRNPLVRLELAWNRTVSTETLRSLIRDPDRTVSAVARRRLIKATDEELKIPNFN